jgi:hypothetical protein
MDGNLATMWHLTKKIFKIALCLILSIIVIFIATEYFYFNQKKVYLHSPDASKTITIYRMFYQKVDEFYLIPNKHKSFLPPKDNYCIGQTRAIAEFAGSFYDGGLIVNWYPSDGSYLKISADCAVNKLHGDIKIVESSAEVGDFEFETIRYSNSSKYTCSTFDDIFDRHDFHLSLLLGVVMLLLLFAVTFVSFSTIFILLAIIGIRYVITKICDAKT